MNGFERKSRKIVKGRAWSFGLEGRESAKVNGREGERIQWSAARSEADKGSGGEQKGRNDSLYTGDSLGRTSNSAFDVNVTDRID